MATFGPPSFQWDGGVNSLSQREALQAFYLLLSVDSGPVGLGVTITSGQNSQVSGYQIKASNTYITSVASGGAAVLPETSTPNSLIGMVATITNTSTTILTVFPNPGDAGSTINGGGSTSVPPGESMLFHCFAPGVWIVDAPSVGQPLVTPIVIGGSLSSSTLTLESTSAVGATDFINFLTGSQIERMRIDTLGHITNGGANRSDNIFGVIPNILINATQVDTSGNWLVGTSWGGTVANNSSAIYLQRSRGATVGSHVAVQANDQLADIEMGGDDGTVFQESASITAFVDGTVAANSVPGRLVFSTTKVGAQFAAEHLRIDNSGLININNQGATITGDRFEVSQDRSGSINNVSLIGYNGAGANASLNFRNTRNAAASGQTALINGDGTGVIRFYGSDGTAYQSSGSISFNVDAAVSAGIVPGRAVISTANSSGTVLERLRIDSSGNIITGGVAAQTFNTVITGLQNNGTNQSSGSISTSRWNAGSGGPNIWLIKSRGASIGTHAAVSSGDQLGVIIFDGDDGTNFNDAAYIQGIVDGAVSLGSVPGRLAFYTGASNAPSERLRIDSAGDAIFFGNSGSAQSLIWAGPIEVPGTTNVNLSLLAFNNSGANGQIWGGRSRGAVGVQTAVTTGDGLLSIFGIGSDGSSFKEAALINFNVDATVTAGNVPGSITMFTVAPGGGQALLQAVYINSAQQTFFNSSFGYNNTPSNGVGGSVTQLTSKSTGVTLNKPTGQITMNNAALPANTSVQFTCTNSFVQATDTILINISSGSVAGNYSINVTAVSAGSFLVNLRNLTAGSLSEALVLTFAVIKAINS